MGEVITEHHVRARGEDGAVTWIRIEEKDGRWFQVNDLSMSPEFRIGDHVQAFSHVPVKGDRVLVRLPNGELLFRYYYQVTKDIFLAQPVNDQFKTLRSDVDGLEVVGVIRQSHRSYAR